MRLLFFILWVMGPGLAWAGPLAVGPDDVSETGMSDGTLDHEASSARIGVGITRLGDGSTGYSATGGFRTELSTGNPQFDSDADSQFGISLNPSLDGHLRFDREGKVRSWTARGDVLNLVRWSSAYKSLKAEKQINGRYNRGSATVKDLARLQGWLAKYKSLATKKAKLEKPLDIQAVKAQIIDSYEQKIDRATKETNPYRKKSQATIDKFDFITLKEVTEPKKQLQKEILDLRVRYTELGKSGPQECVSRLENESDLTPENRTSLCNAKIQSEIKGILKTIEGKQKEIESKEVRRKELQIEFTDLLKESNPGYAEFEKSRMARIEALRKERDHKVKSTVARILRDRKAGIQKLDRAMKDISADYDEVRKKFKGYVSYTKAADADPSALNDKAIALPGYTSFLDFAALGGGYTYSGNRETGASRLTANLHLLRIKYQKALRVAGFDTNFCLEAAPIGGAFGRIVSYKQGVSRRIEGPGDSHNLPLKEGDAYFRTKIGACLKVQMGVLAKLDASGELEYLAGNYQDLTTVNGRVGLKNILGTPIEAAWEVQHEMEGDKTDSPTPSLTTHLFTIGVGTK